MTCIHYAIHLELLLELELFSLLNRIRLHNKKRVEQELCLLHSFAFGFCPSGRKVDYQSSYTRADGTALPNININKKRNHGTYENAQIQNF